MLEGYDKHMTGEADLALGLPMSLEMPAPFEKKKPRPNCRQDRQAG